ncbi:hypothetical protein BJ165DRAFT_1400853 [Panaeolus papilionaceus]|nr:hypothetical protein BJ165DRAFT_1400853 [Panaeolus papilionaceus]
MTRVSSTPQSTLNVIGSQTMKCPYLQLGLRLRNPNLMRLDRCKSESLNWPLNFNVKSPGPKTKVVPKLRELKLQVNIFSISDVQCSGPGRRDYGFMNLNNPPETQSQSHKKSNGTLMPAVEQAIRDWRDTSVNYELPRQECAQTCDNDHNAESPTRTQIFHWFEYPLNVIKVLCASLVQIFVSVTGRNRTRARDGDAPYSDFMPQSRRTQAIDTQWLIEDVLRHPTRCRAQRSPQRNSSQCESEAQRLITPMSASKLPAPLPSQKWKVFSSWDISNPTRTDIESAFDDPPNEKTDRLHTVIYKSSISTEDAHILEQVTTLQRALAQCEAEEATLLLSIEQLQPGSTNTEQGADLALNLARAARTSLLTRTKLYEAKIAQAKQEVQKQVDLYEEVMACLAQADNQLYPIISAFLAAGWTPANLPLSLEGGPAAVFPSPPTLSNLKSITPDDYPYHGAATPSSPTHSDDWGANTSL